MGHGKNSFLNLCAIVWYILHSGTTGEFQDENSVPSCKKYHSLAHASKNLYVCTVPDACRPAVRATLDEPSWSHTAAKE